MNIKKILKKSLTLSLATAVAGQSLQAGILDDSLTNVSASSEIVERDSNGNILRTTYTTPSLYFRFGGTSAYPEPIVNVGAPGISAGCGGLSIKGMFGSIIGLDRLEAMLKNAGASLAWGIAVGLIYSLPGIGSAFKMINHWAKKIQQLLANACQSGQVIGMAMADSMGLNNNAISNGITEWDNQISKLDQSMRTELKEFKIGKFSFNDNMVLQMNDDENPPVGKVLANWEEFLINSLINYSLTANFVTDFLLTASGPSANSFIQETFDNTIDSFETANKRIVYNLSISPNTMSITNDLTIGNLSLKAKIVQRAFKIALIRDFFGDIEVKNEGFILLTLSKIRKLVDSLDGSTSTDSQKKEAEETLTKIVKGELKAWGFNIPAKVKNPEVGVLSTLADLMYKGSGQMGPITQEEQSILTKLEKMNAISYGMLTLPALESEGANAKVILIYARASYDSVNFFNSGDLSFITGGAYESSKKAINEFLNNGTISNQNVPLIVPGLYDKLKILQQTPSNKREEYKNKLIEYNAYHILEAALGGLLEETNAYNKTIPVLWTDGSNVRSASHGIKIDSEKTTNYNNFCKYIGKGFKETVDAMYKHIKEAYGQNVLTPEDLNDMFDKLNMENNKRLLRNGPKPK
jgi:hypothetical protein